MVTWGDLQAATITFGDIGKAGVTWGEMGDVGSLVKVIQHLKGTLREAEDAEQ